MKTVKFTNSVDASDIVPEKRAEQSAGKLSADEDTFTDEIVVVDDDACGANAVELQIC